MIMDDRTDLMMTIPRQQQSRSTSEPWVEWARAQGEASGHGRRFRSGANRSEVRADGQVGTDGR